MQGPEKYCKECGKYLLESWAHEFIIVALQLGLGLGLEKQKGGRG